MKRTTKLLAGAVAVAIGGLAMTSIASATATVTHYPDSNVQYTLNGTEHFTAGTITISDGTTTITMLDRNLGATAAGTGCEDPDLGTKCAGGDNTYGYHFQWGNNYGFDPSSIPATGGQKQTPITYNPFYTDPVFRIGNANWLNDDSVVDLWGGSTSDYIDIVSLDGTNWQVNNATDRQGPCPENFHVPSYGELLKIKYMMGDDASVIRSQLLVPFAGYRNYKGAEVYDLGGDAYLRSSSPSSAGNPNSRNLTLFMRGGGDMFNDSRANANSLRCVYDSYETYTPAGNLSSEGGDSEIIVNIAEFNGGQNTCSGSNYIFENIVAGTNTGTHTLSGVFQCAFGNGRSSSTVTLQLSGNLVADGDRVISGSNLMMKNSEWTVSPVGLKFANTLISTWSALTATQTLFTKTANLIGVASGVVEVQLTVPGGTPDGTYNGVLVLTY